MFSKALPVSDSTFVPISYDSKLMQDIFTILKFIVQPNTFIVQLPDVQWHIKPRAFAHWNKNGNCIPNNVADGLTHDTHIQTINKHTVPIYICKKCIHCYIICLGKILALNCWQKLLTKSKTQLKRKWSLVENGAAVLQYTNGSGSLVSTRSRIL